MSMEDTLQELLKKREIVAQEYELRPSNLTAKYRLQVLDEKLANYKNNNKEASYGNKSEIFSGKG